MDGTSNNEVGAFLAKQLYPEAFSADMFAALFEGEQFEDLDIALAEWYALGAFVFTWCLCLVFKDRFNLILNCFHTALLKQLAPEATKRHFLAIVQGREDEYAEHWQQLTDAPSMARFYGRVTAHVTGTFDSALDAIGVPQLADAAQAVAISHYITNVMAKTKTVMERIEASKG